MDPLKNLRRVVSRRWRGSVVPWRYHVNREAWFAAKTSARLLHTPLSRRALATLRRDGVVTLSVFDLLQGADVWQRLSSEAAAVRCRLGERQPDDGGFKPFLLDEVAGQGAPHWQLGSTALALHPEVLAVVNGFLGLCAELRSLAFWRNIVLPGQPAAASQLWHRDHEDVTLVKLLVYLSDVATDAGPFCYATGSHRGKHRWLDPPTVVPQGTCRADDRAMAQVISRHRWQTITGPAATLILAATKGFHRGGLCVGQERLALSASYFSCSCAVDALPRGVTGIPPDAHPAVRLAGRWNQ